MMPYSTPFYITQRPNGTIKLLSVTGCICLDRLGYGAVTNWSKISVAQHNAGLFLVHNACPV